MTTRADIRPPPQDPGLDKRLDVRSWRARGAALRGEDRLLGNFSSLLGSQVVSAGVGLVYWALAARLLPAAEVGLGAAAIASMTLISFLCVLGAETFLISALRGSAPQRHRVMLTTGLIVPGLLGSAVGALFALGAPHLSESLRSTGGSALNVAVFAVGAGIGTSCLVFDFAVIGVDGGSAQLIRNIVAALVKVPLVPVVAALGLAGGVGLTQTWVASLVLSLVVGVAALRLPKAARGECGWEHRMALVRAHGRGSLGHYALNLALASGPMAIPLLVALTASPTEVAYFSAARLLATGLLAVPYLLTVALFAAAVTDSGALQRRMRHTLPVGLGFYAVTMVALLALGRPLLEVFGTSYARQSLTPLLLLTLAGAPLVIRDHYVAIRRSEGGTARAAKLVAGFTAAELAAAFTGGKLFGVSGLCAFWLAAMLVEALALAPTVCRTAYGSAHAGGEAPPPPERARTTARSGEAPASPQGSRNRALDGIRAVAIVFVVGFHAGAPGFANGGSGVMIFFALSGYLITSILLAAPLSARRLGLFYVKRLLRLFPALAVVVLFCVAYALLALHGHDRSYLLDQSRDGLLYIANFVLSSRTQIHDFGYLGHLWSLAVEEQFYLIWPLVLLVPAACRMGHRARLGFVAGLTLLTAFWMAFLSAAGLQYRVGLGLDGNAVVILMGCTLAILLLPGRRPSEPGIRWLRASAAPCLVLLVVICVGPPSLPLDFLRLVTALATCVLIASIVVVPDSRCARLLASGPLPFVGLLSYSLYLWHPVVFGVFDDMVDLGSLQAKLLWAGPMIAVTVAVALASYHFVEQPFNAMKDRLPSAPTTTSVTSSYVVSPDDILETTELPS